MPKASSAEVEKPKAPKSGRKFGALLGFSNSKNRGLTRAWSVWSGLAVGGGKKTSLYNQYMKKQLTPYKEANPDASHQDAFKAVCLPSFSPNSDYSLILPPPR